MIASHMLYVIYSINKNSQINLKQTVKELVEGSSDVHRGDSRETQASLYGCVVKGGVTRNCIDDI